MDFIKLIATGLAGSTALTGLHQALLGMDEAPRVDLLGKEALEKVAGNGKSGISQSTFYWGSIAGDILSNSAFYSIIAKAKNPIFTGALVGGVIGAFTLISPNLFGLNKDFVRSSEKKKYITLGYYIFGGIAAGFMAKMMKGKR
ncbi:MAG: hypothetical protein ACNS60_19980 [Candidatus Cyclobacteriaceae bacterium M2_1C_046]